MIGIYAFNGRTDNDDPIIFKDPMDELGESFAKLFIREIKKANK